MEDLKQENDRLKYELYVTVKEKDRWNSKCNDFYNICKKQHKTLQEIKGVVTALYMNNWLQMNETARKSIQLLRELITKAESEGNNV